MKGDHVIFKKEQDEWETPQHIFDTLDEEFYFDLDPCATAENHKTLVWFSKEEDGLKQTWGGVQSVLQSAVQFDYCMGQKVLR